MKIHELRKIVAEEKNESTVLTNKSNFIAHERKSSRLLEENHIYDQEENNKSKADNFIYHAMLIFCVVLLFTHPIHPPFLISAYILLVPNFG